MTELDEWPEEEPLCSCTLAYQDPMCLIHGTGPDDIEYDEPDF